MNSSGIKKGLAVSAISALAVAGLPALAGTANAEPITDTLASDGAITSADLDLVNPDGTPTPGQVTTSAYRVVAIASEDVPQVQFQFSTTGAFAGEQTRIGPAAVDPVNGAFSVDFTPTVDGTIRVVAINAAGDLVPGAFQEEDIEVSVPGAADTARITGPTNVGVWNGKAAVVDANDYTMAVSGTTDLTDTASNLDDDYTVVIDQRSGGGAGTVDADVVGATNGTFAGVLPLANYSFTPGGPDQIVVGADPEDRALLGVDNPLTAAVEDAVAKTLYLQVLGSVTAVADETLLQPNAVTDVTVTALDTQGNPVAGADVYKIRNGAAAVLAGTTDAAGTFVDEDENAGAYTYFVNGAVTSLDNDQTANQPALGDRSASVTLENYAPALTDVQVDSRYGFAADEDEISAEGVIATALDQAGNSLENEILFYTWTVDPFDADEPTLTSEEQEAGSVVANGSGVDTDAQGRVAIDFARLGDFDPALADLPSGTYTLNIVRKAVGGNGAFNADPVDFKVGEARVEFTPADVQGPLGGDADVALSLELEDGTKLGSIDYDNTGDEPFTDADDVDRTATIDYTVGVEDNPATPAPADRDGGPGDSRIAPLGEQDDSVVNVPAGGLNASVIFDEAGDAALKLTDATPETQEEFDALVEATTSGDLGTDQTTAAEVDYLETVVADTITDQAVQNAVAGGLRSPGRPAVVSFVVRNENGATLSNKTVEISVAGGGFITDDVAPGTAPAALTLAQQNGVWANKGTTATVRTDGNGVATVVVAIERNEGFDDNFLHTVAVTGTVDGKSDVSNVEFTSKDAVDLASVEIAEDAANVADLPNAQVGRQTVRLDVFAKDQFGNLSDEAFTPSDANNGAANTSGPARTSNLGSPAVLTATATDETSQIISVSIVDLNGALPSGTATDAFDAINWYEVDFAASEFTLQQTGAESVPTGTRVTEVLTAIDQLGQPITGLTVDFFRAGPGPEDSDGNEDDTTDGEGKAFYDFTGGTPGTAQISAVIRDAGTRVGSADDTVTFVGDDVAPIDETVASLRGRNNGARADVLRVVTGPAADGAQVRLFRVVNGNRTLLQTKSLGDAGAARFTVRDRNGRGFTRYVAIVSPTADSSRDVSNSKRVR